MQNPFTPNFGQVPIHMAGRQFLISDLDRALATQGRDPALSTMLIGPRGTGKTALLFYMSEQADQNGWISVNVSSTPGMLEDIIEQTLRKASQLIDVEGAPRLIGMSVAGIAGLEWENPARRELNWRSRMTDLLEALNEQGVGLYITVDEVDPKLDEMVRLVTVYQHFIGEDRKVGLLMAGLPYKVSGLLNGKSTSFLRRAVQYRLGTIEDHDVKDAFRQTVEAGGKQISEQALDEATAAIDGFPFMMQLVGFRAWQRAEGEEVIGGEAMAYGVEMARHDMETRVLRATLDELSQNDLEFLAAMLSVGEPASVADLTAYLGRTSGHVSTYKRRLLHQGVIQERRRGVLEFALPFLREYLPQYL